MSDDCANSWGCSLSTTKSYSATRRLSSLTSFGERDLSGDIKYKVSSDLAGKYVLSRIMACGSDANLFALVELTKGDTNQCVIAAGSYVAGDGGPLQCWSTVTFSPKTGPSEITPPAMVCNEFTKNHTIALPYAIPGVMDSKDLIKYEDDCLNEFHIRCLLAKANKSPYTAILMELMLASNGAILSNRALIMIGSIAQNHGMKIIVDEIMTGGRTGSMLMTLKCPKRFIDQVSHITLGKWLKVGFVLESVAYHKSQTRFYEQTSTRGTSTFVDCREALRIWNEVNKVIFMAESRRKMVLSKLRVDTESAWGEGCIIFAPVRRNGVVSATKNRFLPMLDTQVPIATLNTYKEPTWSKQNVNLKVVEGVLKWVNFRPENEDKLLRKIIRRLVKCNKDDSLKTEDFRDLLLPELETRTLCKLRSLLRKLEAGGCLKYAMKGTKRMRCWVVHESVLPLFINN